MHKKIRRFNKKVKNTLIYWFVLLIVFLLRSIPRKAALAACDGLGYFAFYILRAERRKALTHLDIAFGQEKSECDIQRIARDVFRYLGKNFVDVARIQMMTEDEILENTIIEGEDHVERALARGKGMIVLGGHIGCWEYLGAFISAKWHNCYVISRKLYDPRLEELLINNRKNSGMINLTRGDNTRGIVRALKKRQILGLLIDQDTKIDGIFVDFFGRPAYTASAPAKLSLHYGCPVVPVFIYLDNNDTQHFVAKEELRIEPSGNSEDDVKNLTQRCSTAIEAFIREHPEQWVWMHRRWKTTPPEGRDIIHHHAPVKEAQA